MTTPIPLFRQIYELRTNRRDIIHEKILGLRPVLYVVTPSEKYSECGPNLHFLQWFTSLREAVAYGDLLKSKEEERADHIHINILLDEGKSLLLKTEEIDYILDLEKRKEESEMETVRS